MAIFNSYYPEEMYDKSVPEDVKELKDAVCILCAEGQKFVGKNGLNVKTEQYYYTIDDPRYPDGGNGQLCDFPGNEPAVWMTGTVFAISRNRFITAKHVVEDVLAEVDSSDFKKLKIASGYYKKSSPSSKYNISFLRVKTVDLYEEKDLAVIETYDSLPSTVDPLQLAGTSEQRGIRTGDQIYMLGYPLGQPLKYSKGTVCEINSGDLDNFKGWISSFAGNSGSPVFNNRTGNVIGVMSSGSMQSDWMLNTSFGCYQYAPFPDDEDHYASFIYVEELNL